MFAKFKSIIYIQISPERLILKNLKSGEIISVIPEMAISAPPSQQIIAIGTQARQAASMQPAQLINPFAHPRSLLSDFTVAEKMLKYYLHLIRGKSFFMVTPIVIIHPLGSPAGGFTQIECRAFRELGMGAGASKTIVWTGRKLTDQEALSMQFPSDGEVID